MKFITFIFPLLAVLSYSAPVEFDVELPTPMAKAEQFTLPNVSDDQCGVLKASDRKKIRSGLRFSNYEMHFTPQKRIPPICIA